MWNPKRGSLSRSIYFLVWLGLCFKLIVYFFKSIQVVKLNWEMQHLQALDAMVDRLESIRQHDETARDLIDFFVFRVWIYITATSNRSLDAAANHFLPEFLKLKNAFTDAEFQHGFIESATYLFGEANATIFDQLLTLWTTSSPHFTASSLHTISANYKSPPILPRYRPTTARR